MENNELTKGLQHLGDAYTIFVNLLHVVERTSDQWRIIISIIKALGTMIEEIKEGTEKDN